MNHSNNPELIKLDLVREHYLMAYPTAKRRVSKKRIQQDWAGMYEHMLDSDPCQVGCLHYYFWSNISLEEYTKLFHDVETIELEKRNHSPYASTDPDPV